MLTHHDVTVPNAVDVFKKVRDLEFDCVGFKDVGLRLKELRILVHLMKEAGKTIFFEIVSGNNMEYMQSVKNAVTLDVDYLIGGTYVQQTLQALEDRIDFMPYIGRVEGHPCMLKGELNDIMSDAKRVEKMGVAGINLLAYRYNGDPEQLMNSMRNTVDIPVIAAGDINSFKRIRKVTKLGMWGFTIGTAIFENRFMPKGNIKDQITAILTTLRC